MLQPAFTPQNDDRFDELRRCLALLLETVPSLCGVLGEPHRWTGRPAVKMRYESLEFCRRRGTPPPLVAVLMGPTGAGKSSWFRLLTGVDVPAGGALRPMTRGCAVAVPPEFSDDTFLSGVFPDYRMVRLETSDQLCRATSDDLLFHYPSSPKEGGQGLPLILADVPDFNSVECENWKSAEKMLARAELVVFVVQGDAYSDHRSVEMLAKCCRSAANLIYLITKTSPDAAQAKRRHLLQLVAEKKEFGFHEMRADGRTLMQFLADSRFYCSPFADERTGPRLHEAVPLDEGSPGLVSWLRGQDGSRLVFLGLLEAVREATFSAKELLVAAMRHKEKLEADLKAFDELVRQAAESVSRGLFPEGRLLELAIEESRRQSPGWLRSVVGVIGFFSGTAKTAVRAVTEFVQSWNSRQAAGETPTTAEELEKANLPKAVESLIDKLRTRFPEAATPGGMLSAERCNHGRENLLRQELPKAGTEWENAVRQKLAEWCRQNPWMAASLMTIPPTLEFASIGLIVADLGLSGGVFGTTLGALTGVAASNAAAAQLLARFEKLKMKHLAEQAFSDWAKQRADELEVFLREHFAEGLAGEWQRNLRQLETNSIDRCRQACETIENRLQAERDDGRLGAAPVSQSAGERT